MPGRPLQRRAVALALVLAAAAPLAACTSQADSSGDTSPTSMQITDLPTELIEEEPLATGEPEAPVLVPLEELFVTVTVGGVAEFAVPEGTEAEWTIRSSDTAIIEVTPGSDGVLPSARGVAEGTAKVFIVDANDEQVGFILTVVP